jgi:hypothetical protein
MFSPRILFITSKRHLTRLTGSSRFCIERNSQILASVEIVRSLRVSSIQRASIVIIRELKLSWCMPRLFYLFMLIFFLLIKCRHLLNTFNLDINRLWLILSCIDWSHICNSFNIDATNICSHLTSVFHNFLLFTLKISLVLHQFSNCIFMHLKFIFLQLY